MTRIKLTNWFMKGNELVISLIHYYVTICPIMYNNELSYVMNVMDDENNKTLYFNTLEECIMFTEEVININSNLDNIIREYNEYSENPKRYRKK